MAEVKNEILKKELLVKKYGDSLYIPLTKFFKHMGIKQNSIVTVVLLDNGKLVITPSK